MLGAAAVALAWLPDGLTDASLALSNNAWDMAAGAIIASEAGATVSDLDGSHDGPVEPGRRLPGRERSRAGHSCRSAVGTEPRSPRLVTAGWVLR